MITTELFEKILIEPSKQGANQLYIVSGYATSAMAFHHLNMIQKNDKNIDINLIIGMTTQDGLSASNHRGFQQLMEEEFPNNFKCNYISSVPPVHSKIYVWCKNNKPIQCFLGSANYTQIAFLSPLRNEVMTTCSPKDGFAYFQDLIDNTISCTHTEAEKFVNIYDGVQQEESTIKYDIR